MSPFSSVTLLNCNIPKVAIEFILGDLTMLNEMRFRLSILSIFLLIVAGCAKVPETGRTQLLMISTSAEVDMGVTAFEQISEDLDFVEEGYRVEMIQRVGERIAAAAEPALAKRGFPELDWEFMLVDDETVNAFVLPGGKIVFYAGIVDLVETEEGIATVMGHEIGHLVGRHAAERLSQHVLVNMSLAAAQRALSDRDPGTRDNIISVLGAGAAVGVMLPYSRTHEREADEIGLILMARAGYDPREAINVWERMAELQTERPPEFLSTHPDPERRIEHLNRVMPRALEEYGN